MTSGDLGGLYSRSSLRPGVKKKEACCLIGYQEPFCNWLGLLVAPIPLTMALHNHIYVVSQV